MGVNAGFNNTTGSNNSFIGSYAGYGAPNGGVGITGNYNSFLGDHAGFSNKGGSGNSFIGFQAGYSNSAGEGNSFLGSFTGYKNTGSGNSFVGVHSGFNNTGNYNLFLGSSAGYKNKEGNNNSFVGMNAGQSNITGSNNTLIGASADVTSDSLQFATAIGSNSKAIGDNMIVLGKIEGTYNGIWRPADTVIVRGSLELETLRAGFGAPLCRKPLTNEIVNCSSSSLRYKKNVAPFSSGLNLLQRLKPISFEWKDGGMKDVGFGAEDVAAVEPLLVTYNEKGEVEGVKYDRIATVLVNAIKEQQAQIEAQQQQLKEQQGQLKLQQAVIDGLKKLLCKQTPNAEVCKQ